MMLLASGEEVPGHHTRYVIEHMVGLGAYGAVYSAHDPETPSRQIALKEFFPARHPRDQAPLRALFDRERMIGMQASPHPLMPTFYEAFQSEGHFYIAQEFIVGRTLDDIIARRHPLTREWVLKWSVSLCDALAFLHSHQIVHHDLKPANIRITPQGHLCLLDFGAGWGRTIRPFLRDVEFAGLFGFEPDFLFCTLARALNPYAAFLTGGTTPAGELPGGFFDVVFSWSVFSHLSPASAALWLQELARALVPGGTLVFTTWGARFLHRLRNEAAARAAGAAIDWYSGVCLDAAGSIEDRIGDYASGGFIWFTSGQSKVYGEAFISEAALARLLDEHRIPLVLVRSDTSTLGQDALVLRRV